MINGLSALVVIALFIEAFISYTKTIYDEHKIQWQIVLAFLLAAALCYDTNLNLFSTFGLTEKYPIVGILATAMVMSRGSNYFFEFYNTLSKWREGKGLLAENTSTAAFPDTTTGETTVVVTEPIDEIEQEDVKVANR